MGPKSFWKRSFLRLARDDGAAWAAFVNRYFQVFRLVSEGPALQLPPLELRV